MQRFIYERAKVYTGVYLIHKQDNNNYIQIYKHQQMQWHTRCFTTHYYSKYITVQYLQYHIDDNVPLLCKNWWYIFTIHYMHIINLHLYNR